MIYLMDSFAKFIYSNIIYLFNIGKNEYIYKYKS